MCYRVAKKKNIDLSEVNGELIYKWVKAGDPDEYTGFAFGVGLERIALLKYEIDDMRLLYENDSRFLKQF